MRSLFPRHNNRDWPARGGSSLAGPRTAVTLLELLIAFAIVILIMVVLLEFVTSVEKTWKSAATDPFAEAESAFSEITQTLASATLEPYQDYADSSGAFRASTTGTFVPNHLARRSDLAFVCGPSSGTNGLLTASGRLTFSCAVFFLAPLGYTQTESGAGMEKLLNAMGYFVEFGSDPALPSFLPASVQHWRWRLKEVRQPAESLQIYTLTSSSAWIQPLVASGATTPVLADNVIALVILPERAASDSGAALSTDYRYDSRDDTNPLTRNQLPARLRVALMAIDEASAQILATQNGTNPPALVSGNLFQKASQLDADLSALDSTLTSQRIGHRLFQREILVNSSAWSNTLSQ